MARRIIVSLVLTLVLLFGARQLSKRNPVDLAVEGSGMRIEHRTVTEHIRKGQPVIRARIESTKRIGAAVCYVVPPSDSVRATPMFMIDPNVWEARLPRLQKGQRLRYWIRVINSDEAILRCPEDPARAPTIKFKGQISKPVLTAHIAFMFGSFFFMVMSLFGAVRILRGQEGKRITVNMARWVLILSFIGGWPLGFILNRQAFGPVWEGFPFGYDITDNKTQLVFIFWLVSLLLAWGSFIGRGEEKDCLKAKPFAIAIVLSFLMSLALFLLPHSL